LQINQRRTQRLMHLGLIIALILAIVAGVELSNVSEVNTALTLRKVSAVLFAVLYVVFVLLHAYYWMERQMIQLTRRTVSYLPSLYEV
jgi:uncharacterized membrane protein YdcZ (DUF606 family)